MKSLICEECKLREVSCQEYELWGGGGGVSCKECQLSRSVSSES